MGCAGRKQLSRALELFLQGLTAPTYVCSAITAATYKKYAVVSLIHTGEEDSESGQCIKGTLCQPGHILTVPFALLVTLLSPPLK
jgi:hypothetical protein